MPTPCYRHANYRTPLRMIASEGEGRFNRPGDLLPTQYFTDHPLGPWAEFARWDRDALRHPGAVQVRIWVLLVDLAPLVHIGFDEASSFGIAPQALVGDDYAPCQDLADRLRDSGAPGLVVPSAALPGARTVALFGEFLLARYAAFSVEPNELRGCLVADEARPPREVVKLYRERGRAHSAYLEWENGEPYEVVQPLLFD